MTKSSLTSLLATALLALMLMFTGCADEVDNDTGAQVSEKITPLTAVSNPDEAPASEQATEAAAGCGDCPSAEGAEGSSCGGKMAEGTAMPCGNEKAEGDKCPDGVTPEECGDCPGEKEIAVETCPGGMTPDECGDCTGDCEGEEIEQTDDDA